MKDTVIIFVSRQIKLSHIFLSTLTGFFLLTGCASTPRWNVQPDAPTISQADTSAIGTASYYADKYHGRKTASGEIYDKNKMTAAHRTLPFGVTVRVTDLSSGRSVLVRINDRGPFVRGRIIDLSLAAAKRLGIVHSGQASVRIEVVSQVTSAAVAEADQVH